VHDEQCFTCTARKLLSCPLVSVPFAMNWARTVLSAPDWNVAFAVMCVV
jgi:hypothetical protein